MSDDDVNTNLSINDVNDKNIDNNVNNDDNINDVNIKDDVNINDVNNDNDDSTNESTSTPNDTAETPKDSPEMKEVPLTPPIEQPEETIPIKQIATGKRIEILEEIANANREDNKEEGQEEVPDSNSIVMNIDDEDNHLSPLLYRLKNSSFKSNVLLLSLLALPIIILFLAFALGKTDPNKESVARFMGRITIFLMVNYIFWEIFSVLCLMIPSIILKIGLWFNIPPESKVILLISSLKCINKSVRNILTLITIAFFYNLLFDSAKMLMYNEAIKNKQISMLNEAKQIGLGQGIEKLIFAIHSLGLCVVPEQMMMASISRSYTRNVRARVERDEILRLQRVILDIETHFQDCEEFISAIADLEKLTKLEEGEYMTADNADICIRDASDRVAGIIMSSLIGFGSPRQLKMDDFEQIKFNEKMFPRKHKDAFEFLDINRNSSIGKDELSRSILTNLLVKERNKHSISGAVNIVSHLDSFLFTFAAMIGVMIAVISASAKGLDVVNSFSSAVIGLSFLLNSVAARIFDILIFVFVCHNYDVHDRVIIDGRASRIQKIMIFTTLAIDEKTGALLYMPSADIRGKNIENMDRKEINYERIYLPVGGNFELYKLRAMQKEINAILLEKDDDFGECKVTYTQDEDEYYIRFEVAYRSIVPLTMDRSIRTKRCQEIDQIVKGVMETYQK